MPLFQLRRRYFAPHSLLRVVPPTSYLRLFVGTPDGGELLRAPVMCCLLALHRHRHCCLLLLLISMLPLLAQAQQTILHGLVRSGVPLFDLHPCG